MDSATMKGLTTFLGILLASQILVLIEKKFNLKAYFKSYFVFMENHVEVEKAIKHAWIAGIILIVVALFNQSRNYDPLNFIDIVIIGPLTFGIYRKNFVCAVLMVIFFLGSKILMWDQLKINYFGLILAILFSYFFIKGMLATFAYKKLSSEQPNK